MARNYGISVDEAKRRVLLQREVEALGKELRQQPNFSGIEIVADSNNFAVNVSFAQGAPIPQGVLDRFPNLKPSLRVRQTGREIAAQRSLRGRVTAALARAKVDASIGQKSIDGGLIIQTNDVEKVRTFLAGIDGDIEIVYNPNPVPPPTVNLHGGQEMSGCTSGFGAADYLDPNKKGMLSAGHCVISWGGTVSSGTTVYTQGAYLPVPRAKFYEEDDFLWAYSSQHTGTNLFFDSAVLRPVTAIRYDLVSRGQDVCKYGKATGLRCGVVTEPERTWTTANGIIGPLVELTNNYGENIAQCGDSGGPAFMMNMAYGIQSRGDKNGQCLGGDQAWYADIYYAGELSASVLTQ